MTNKWAYILACIVSLCNALYSSDDEDPYHFIDAVVHREPPYDNQDLTGPILRPLKRSLHPVFDPIDSPTNKRMCSSSQYTTLSEQNRIFIRIQSLESKLEQLAIQISTYTMQMETVLKRQPTQIYNPSSQALLYSRLEAHASRLKEIDTELIQTKDREQKFIMQLQTLQQSMDARIATYGNSIRSLLTSLENLNTQLRQLQATTTHHAQSMGVMQKQLNRVDQTTAAITTWQDKFDSSAMQETLDTQCSSLQQLHDDIQGIHAEVQQMQFKLCQQSTLNPQVLYAQAEEIPAFKTTTVVRVDTTLQQPQALQHTIDVHSHSLQEIHAQLSHITHDLDYLKRTITAPSATVESEHIPSSSNSSMQQTIYSDLAALKAELAALKPILMQFASQQNSSPSSSSSSSASSPSSALMERLATKWSQLYTKTCKNNLPLPRCIERTNKLLADIPDTTSVLAQRIRIAQANRCLYEYEHTSVAEHLEEAKTIVATINPDCLRGQTYGSQKVPEANFSYRNLNARLEKAKSHHNASRSVPLLILPRTTA